jgi:hypothetical protein
MIWIATAGCSICGHAGSSRLRHITSSGELPDLSAPAIADWRAGVMHLMGLAFQYLDREYRDEQISQARAPLLAAALLQDVGHGPFSHVFEPCLGIDHEQWSIATILDEDTGVNKVLRKIHKSLPQTVAELIDPDNNDHPPWQKYLLSSQIDMDRLDYLMRQFVQRGWMRALRLVSHPDEL